MTLRSCNDANTLQLYDIMLCVVVTSWSYVLQMTLCHIVVVLRCRVMTPSNRQERNHLVCTKCPRLALYLLASLAVHLRKHTSILVVSGGL